MTATMNAEMGKGTLRFSAEGMGQPWKMRRGKDRTTLLPERLHAPLK